MTHIKHPLLDDLRRFDAEAAIRYPAEYDNGLGQMGMLLYAECRTGGYWCTPSNSMAFATTGGDGVHFSFIVEDDNITEDSPVIVTVPAAFGDGPETASFVVGDSLRNFLRFGLHRGYFALEQLTYYRDLTLQVYSSPEWQPTEKWHHSVGYLLHENGQRIRDFLAERFSLTPLAYTADEFDALQNRFKPLLEYPSEDHQ
ncbi:MAG: hypothetical protein JW818_04660 [Pirellulales bacterium]|nr:hypothetical protein [Pirellulales bacterium]